MNWERAAARLGWVYNGVDLRGTMRGHTIVVSVGEDSPGWKDSLASAAAFFSPMFDLGVECSVEILFARGSVHVPRGGDKGRIDPLLAGGIGEELAALPDVITRLNDMRLVVSHRGAPVGDDWAVWAVDIVARAAQRFHAARANVPVKPTLVSVAPPIERLAAELGLTFITCPLGVVGSIDGVAVEASVREHVLGPNVQLGASYPSALDFSLRMEPQHLPGPLDYIKHGADVLVGDRELDRAFRIRTNAPERLIPRLHPKARADLLVLRNAGEIVVDDAGVRVDGAKIADAADLLARAARAAAFLSGAPDVETAGAFR